jgi:hypothetical protein
MTQCIKVIFLWLLMPLVLHANHVHWLGEYDKALQLARKVHKPLLVVVVKKDSKSCNTILHTQFMNHSYIDTINEKFISVIVTYEGRTSYPIEMYYTTVFPTLFFVDTQTETFIREPLYGDQISQKVLLQYFQP